ncbi:expressed unknown protein [Seminavis robusta]|uniref:STI1 domain-containing protein n=1 Tax=Seminavis robusta TaxID=568900 RepID=A0A9N8DRW0_9STRA|nr:expressed unknown protein [Seminavis robusta]|eukprot:Sro325_g117820.1 n/a (239) ;mRNA; r:44550-45266
MTFLGFVCFIFVALVASSHSLLVLPVLNRQLQRIRAAPAPLVFPTWAGLPKARGNIIVPLATAEGSDDASIDDKDEEDEEEVEPGKMRVSEIKAELDTRGVAYDDCFDKESLDERLTAARMSGKANPELIDQFNKQRLEDQFEGRQPVDEALSDDVLLDQAVGNDGNLPGGLSPEQFKNLVENPEVMTLLQSTKMQEAMKLVMTGGQEELEQALKDDTELRDMVGTLQSILGGPPGGA